VNLFDKLIVLNFYLNKVLIFTALLCHFFKPASVFHVNLIKFIQYVWNSLEGYKMNNAVVNLFR